MRLAKGQPSWTSWGGGLANLRFQAADAAGFAGAEAEHLRLKWAFGVPEATSLRSQPAVYQGRLLFAGAETVYSLDVASGCTYWATEMPVPVRSGITIGAPAGTPLAFFGDAAANVHAINVMTGAPVWQTHADANPAAMVTGTPAYYKERLYVPVSSFEELSAIALGYVCCTFRGSILALDARTGKSLWQTFTIEDARREPHVTKSGAKSIGPSGAGVWSAPTIDSEKDVLYAATGDNYSDPPSDKSDALIALPGDPPPLDPEKGGGMFALRLDNGERLWMTPPSPCGARRPCSPGQPGAVTVIPGVVFSGSLDGHLRGYSTVDGKILWDYDTVHEYGTVNGVSGHGGSLNVAGPVIVGGTLYAISGYDQFGGMPGNVLLAFTVDGR